jgi:VWFA-related protein
LVFAAAGAAPAQPPSETPAGSLERPFTDVVEVRLVNLEVVVTDRQGQPIPGLRAEDFEVFEDGKRVEITHFTAYDSAPRPASPHASTAPEAVEQPAAGGEAPPRSAAPEPLLLVAYIDNFNLRPHTRERVLDSLRTFLDESLRPGDAVMLVSALGSLEVIQRPTTDRQALARALDVVEEQASAGLYEDAELQKLISQMATRYRDGAAAALEQERLEVSQRFHAEEMMLRVRHSLLLLEGFVRSLGEVPGRKVLLHVSDGLSIPSQAEPLRRLMAQANASRVSFVTLDGGGSRALGPDSAAVPAAARDMWTRGLSNAREDERERTLRNLAAGTGGVFLREGNALAANLGEMRRDLEAYYLLGYEPREGGEGEDRQIRVKVKAKGARLRYPTSYRVKAEAEHLGDLALAALYLGGGDNPLGLRVQVAAAEVQEAGLVQPVVVRVPLGEVLLVEHDGVWEGGLAIALVVGDDVGGTSEIQSFRIPLRIPAAELEKALAEPAAYWVELAVEPGPKRVAFAVQDELGRTTSAVVGSFEARVPEG